MTNYKSNMGGFTEVDFIDEESELQGEEDYTPLTYQQEKLSAMEFLLNEFKKGEWE